MIKRNSGATIDLNCVLKTGIGMPSQADFMGDRPDIFVPVLARTHDGYIMPRWTKPTTLGVIEALDVLSSLWQSPALRGPSTRTCDYHDYVMAIDLPIELAALIASMFDHLDLDRLHYVRAVHGDATFDNVVVDPDTLNARWIDPNIRPVPFIAELDAGKVLQSLAGYDGDWSETVRHHFTCWVEKHRLYRTGMHYFFLTHLARLWPYQPQRHEWVMDVIRSRRGLYF